MKRASAGSRRTLVTIQRMKSGLTQDLAGHINQKTETNWEAYCKRWAKVEYSGGSETIVGDQLVSNTSWVMTLPNDEATRAVTMGMRVKFDGHTCGITEPPFDADQNRREMMVKCVEVKR